MGIYSIVMGTVFAHAYVCMHVCMVLRTTKVHSYMSLLGITINNVFKPWNTFPDVGSISIEHTITIPMVINKTKDTATGKFATHESYRFPFIVSVKCFTIEVYLYCVNNHSFRVSPHIGLPNLRQECILCTYVRTSNTYMLSVYVAVMMTPKQNWRRL